MKLINEKDGLWLTTKTNGNIWYKGQYVNYIEYGYWIDNWITKHQIRFYLV